MKPMPIVIATLLSLLIPVGGPALGAPDEETKEKLRQELVREFEKVGESLVDNVLKVVEEAVQPVLKRQQGRIEELEKALAARELEISELKRRIDALGKSPSQPAPLTNGFLGVAFAVPSEARSAELELESGQGAEISSVVPGGPAEAAGLLEGDIIIAVGDRSVGPDELNQAVRSRAPGAKVSVTLFRGTKKLTRQVELGDRVKFLADLKAVEKEKVVLGILVEETDSGLEIREVDEGLTGAVAKLEVGDIIKTLNKKSVATIEQMQEILDQLSVGDRLTFEVSRQGETVRSAVVAGHGKGDARLLDVPKEEVAEPEKAEKPEEKKPEPVAPEAKPAFLGVEVEETDNTVKVIAVQPDTAAAACGVEVDDLIREVNDTPVRAIDDLKAVLTGKVSGDTIQLVVERAGQRITLGEVTLGAEGEKVTATKKPAERTKGHLGIYAQEDEERGVVFVAQVTEGGPADKGGLKVDDVIVKIQDTTVKTIDDMISALQDALEGDVIAVLVRRGDTEEDLRITLGKKPSS